MKKLRVYVDTSVVGGYFDIEFEEWSKALVNDFRVGRYEAVVSNVVAREIAAAPDFVRELYTEMLSWPAEIVSVDEEALSLVAQCKARGVLSNKFLEDMLHIARATIADVDRKRGKGVRALYGKGVTEKGSEPNGTDLRR